MLKKFVHMFIVNLPLVQIKIFATEAARYFRQTFSGKDDKNFKINLEGR